MKQIKSILHLIRVKHWVKNLLVLVPLFFAGGFSDPALIGRALLAFLAFSLVASAIYILNDLRDRESDARHPRKRTRPIASGAVSVKAAVAISGILLIGAALFAWSGTLTSQILLLVYLILNIGYSLGLKHRPLADVAIIASGFVIRVLVGAYAVGTELSPYFLLSIFAVSLFLAFGKRRNELDGAGFATVAPSADSAASGHTDIDGVSTRPVLRFYTRAFLDKNMYVMAALALALYSMWATSAHGGKQLLLATVPVIVFAFVRYSFVLEKAETEGDPSELILSDKPLLMIIALAVILLSIGLYG